MDRHGQNYRPGKLERVLVTTLNNVATPLIPREINDWAEKSRVCQGGRVGQALKRIVGTSLRLLRISLGDFWPSFGFHKLRKSNDINTYQVGQSIVDHVEFMRTFDTPGGQRGVPLFAPVPWPAPSHQQISVSSVTVRAQAAHESAIAARILHSFTNADPSPDPRYQTLTISGHSSEH